MTGVNVGDVITVAAGIAPNAPSDPKAPRPGKVSVEAGWGEEEIEAGDTWELAILAFIPTGKESSRLNASRPSLVAGGGAGIAVDAGLPAVFTMEATWVANQAAVVKVLLSMTVCLSAFVSSAFISTEMSTARSCADRVMLMSMSAKI